MLQWIAVVVSAVAGESTAPTCPNEQFLKRSKCHGDLEAEVTFQRIKLKVSFVFSLLLTSWSYSDIPSVISELFNSGV